MRVALLTGGGDCPGLNAVSRAVTKPLIHHGNAEVLDIADGVQGLISLFFVAASAAKPRWSGRAL